MYPRGCGCGFRCGCGCVGTCVGVGVHDVRFILSLFYLFILFTNLIYLFISLLLYSTSVVVFGLCPSITPTHLIH